VILTSFGPKPVSGVKPAAQLRTGCARDSSSIQVHGVGLHVGIRIGVAGMVVANQEQVGSELQGMPAMSPVQVLTELIHGDECGGCARERHEIIQAAQEHSWVVREPGAVHALANEAPMKFVDQPRRNQ
jgi:predicted Fe-S protein YdhL (DUF1289 family)